MIPTTTRKKPMVDLREYRRAIAVKVGRGEWIKDTLGGLVAAFVTAVSKGA